MNKSIEAIFGGYWFFKVNNDYYCLYNKAKNKVDLIKNELANINFVGYHIFKGWRGFYQKHTLK